MHAYLLIGNEEQLVKAVNKLLENIAVLRRDIELQKIADIRKLISETKIKQKEKICYVAPKFNSATTETQNAFLKLLEEPPSNVSFILTADNKNNILPTILSRCQVTHLKPVKVVINNQNAKQFVSASPGEKLKIISTINKRDEAIDFLKALLYEKNLNAQISEVILETLHRIESNANIQLQLTNLVSQTSLN